MAPHFAQMLTEPDETLFSHGACHVFAQVLQEHFGYQLVVMRRLQGTHDAEFLDGSHIQCSA